MAHNCNLFVFKRYLFGCQPFVCITGLTPSTYSFSGVKFNRSASACANQHFTVLQGGVVYILLIVVPSVISTIPGGNITEKKTKSTVTFIRDCRVISTIYIAENWSRRHNSWSWCNYNQSRCNHNQIATNFLGYDWPDIHRDVFYWITTNTISRDVIGYNCIATNWL